MKRRLTTSINILILGMLAYLVPQSVLGQEPIELQQTQSASSIIGTTTIPSCDTAPVITCPSIYYGCPGDVITPDITGFATAIPGDIDCEDPIVTYVDAVISDGPCSGAKEIHRIWTAVYPNNSNPYLYADCTQLILLSDNEGPIITGCPQDTEVAPNENCEAIVTWSEPSASDNCALMSLASDYPSGSTFPMGITTVTYTATDSCGKTTICSFDINVNGSCCFDAPLLTCPIDYIGCPTDGSDPTITGSATAESGSDFCGDPIVTYQDNVISNGSCSGAITLERTWTATYESNSTLAANCVQHITLEDVKAPIITNVPQDITIAPNDNCSGIATWSQPVATDNCSVPLLAVDYPSGSLFDEGSTIVTYSAIDDCGNSSTYSFTVTVSSCCNTPPAIICPDDFEGCPGTETNITIESNCTASPSTYTGWAVATCNADNGSDDPVGVIYDIRNTTDAPTGQDWAASITDIHPENWTLMQIGQVFGIALGEDDDVYLGASDIYNTQYDTDPYDAGQIFKAEADNAFLATPFVELPNTGGALNGIGNLVYDKVYHQLFASNLEDGKIYRIASDGTILDSYDPWTVDDGSAGIVSPSEQIWGIGMNIENDQQKLYFARIDGSTREMYSITLEEGQFPQSSSEHLEFSNIIGVGKRISDIAFSDDNSQMIFAERGTKFTTGAHDSKMLRYSLNNDAWQMDFKYHVGAWVTQQYPSIEVDPGENSAGGVTFGATTVDNDIEGCDQLVWTTMNYFRTPDENLYYGIQGIDVDGNNSSESTTDPNTETDIIIDFDGQYDNFIQKGDLGDVEIFQAGGSLSNQETGIATASSGGAGCGEPLITYSDELISEGPCTGAKVIERTWIATDSENISLSSSCIQTITLEDEVKPTFTDVPQNITLSPNTNCEAIATWAAPVASDNCEVVSVTSNHNSGDTFIEGITSVTYTATDKCGNSQSISFTVTVTECCIDAPTISCPAIFKSCPGTSIHPENTGVAAAQPGSDHCGAPIISYNDDVVSSGPCGGAKHIIRTWTATDPDNANLTATCDQVIILEDNIAPEIFDCPADITLSTTGLSAIVTWSEPTATDNCGLEWIMGDHLPGDEFPLGSTLVTYTAVDDCENVTPCTFTITVESEGTIACPDDITVPCSGTDGTIVTWNLPTIDTNCDACAEGDSITGFMYMGTLNGSNYYCSTSPAASASASAISASHGGYLASITSQEENDLLSSFLMTQCALIGLSDVQSEGNYTWASGEGVVYTNWASQQPNNYNGNQDCAVICTDGWHDSHCEVAYEFIMEVPCTTYEQTEGPANGSVFPVGTETISYVVTDGCGTSLTCSFDVTVEEGVSLNCPADYSFECPAGQTNANVYWNTPTLTSCCTDCNSTSEAIPGYMYMGSFGGSKYFCSIGNATWPQANTIAQSYGGHLAEINDAEENAFLADILTLQRAWIGLNDATNEGQFLWSTGKQLTYSNWYPGQPNNTNNYQDYVSMLNDGQWNDEYNNLAMEYIMEVPCTSVTQIGGPVSGSTFGLGTTTITYAGVDGCGNTDTCSFDITILGSGACQSYAQDSWYMWIENIGLGSFSNASGNNGGYADFTEEECIDITAGNTYPITLSPGFSNSLYTVYWKIWIDYNQDGDYFDAGEYVAYGSGFQELNGQVPITTSCLVGETTMRVSMKYGTYPSGPCAIFSNGEVEDYCVNILEGSSTIDLAATASATLLSQADYTHALQVTDDLPFDIDSNGEVLEEASTSSNSIELNVYPNPTSDKISLELDTDETLEFYLLDASGQVVLRQSINFEKNSNTLDLGHLHNGIYLLKSIDGKYAKKVLIQK